MFSIIKINLPTEKPFTELTYKQVHWSAKSKHKLYATLNVNYNNQDKNKTEHFKYKTNNFLRLGTWDVKEF